MAVNTGAWKARASGPVPYVGAAKWGTGINRVHAHYDNGDNIAPNTGTNVVPAIIVEPEQYDGIDSLPETWGFVPEDGSASLWGYGTETGTSLRTPLGQNAVQARAAVPVQDGIKFPSWGRRRGRVPGGTRYRAVDNGAETTSTSKKNFKRSAAAGHINKAHAAKPNDSVTSDVSQLLVNTSEVQRDKVRRGSQISGTASQYDAPIASRVPGPREYVPSGDYRHAEMLPKSQEVRLRPFWQRSVGTGFARMWQGPNAGYQSEPLTRITPQQPYAGPQVGATDQAAPGDHVFGFTSEDVVY